jgi:hypothetical protein
MFNAVFIKYAARLSRTIRNQVSHPYKEGGYNHEKAVPVRGLGGLYSCEMLS